MDAENGRFRRRLLQPLRRGPPPQLLDAAEAREAHRGADAGAMDVAVAKAPRCRAVAAAEVAAKRKSLRRRFRRRLEDSATPIATGWAAANPIADAPAEEGVVDDEAEADEREGGYCGDDGIDRRRRRRRRPPADPHPRHLGRLRRR